MSTTVKKLLTLCMLSTAAAFSSLTHAVEHKIGGHLGAYGTAADSGLGGGVHFATTPNSLASFHVDLSTAAFTAGTYYSASPGIVFYGVDYAEFKLGLLGGPGFYSLPNDKLRFGLHFGVMGDFAISEEWDVGMESRYAAVLGTRKNVWSVLLTFGHKFIGKGDW